MTWIDIQCCDDDVIGLRIYVTNATGPTLLLRTQVLQFGSRRATTRFERLRIVQSKLSQRSEVVSMPK